MSVIDVEALLDDVSPLEPCGPDLEYDPSFGEMERAAEGRPEQQYGDTVIPAEEPDWREVRTKALEVAERSRDLRVIPYLSRALLRVDGFEGFNDSLALLRGYIEKQWEFVHPQLDPDDDNDPTLRINVLRELCDPVHTLKLVREAPLVNSRALGQFTLHDLALARGDATAAPGTEDAIPSLSTIDGAFMEAEPDELTSTHGAIQAALEHVSAVEDLATSHVPPGEGPDLSPLVEILKVAGDTIGERLAARGLSGPGTDAGDGDTAAVLEQGAAPR